MDLLLTISTTDCLSFSTEDRTPVVLQLVEMEEKSTPARATDFAPKSSVPSSTLWTCLETWELDTVRIPGERWRYTGS
jgi:hypothetical protein